MKERRLGKEMIRDLISAEHGLGNLENRKSCKGTPLTLMQWVIVFKALYESLESKTKLKSR